MPANTKSAYVAKHHAVTLDGQEYVVSEHSIGGMQRLTLSYDAWELDQPIKREDGSIRYYHAHSTVTTIDGVWYGSVETRQLPAELEALKPGSDERYERVSAYLDSLKALAAQIVRQVVPEVDERYGNLELTGEKAEARLAHIQEA